MVERVVKELFQTDFRRCFLARLTWSNMYLSDEINLKGIKHVDIILLIK